MKAHVVKSQQMLFVLGGQPADELED